MCTPEISQSCIHPAPDSAQRHNLRPRDGCSKLSYTEHLLGAIGEKSKCFTCAARVGKTKMVVNFPCSTEFALLSPLSPCRLHAYAHTWNKTTMIFTSETCMQISNSLLKRRCRSPWSRPLQKFNPCTANTQARLITRW